MGLRSGGGARRLVKEWELYQAVTPGEPEGNGRSCLTGETGTVEVDGATTTEGVDRSKVRVLERVPQCTHRERNRTIAHRSRGRLEDLCLAACVTADRTDSSIWWAAKMEGIDSSKEAGSSMSAGTRLFKNSTVRVWLGVGVGVEVGAGRVEVDPGSGVARCD